MLRTTYILTFIVASLGLLIVLNYCDDPPPDQPTTTSSSSSTTTSSSDTIITSSELIIGAAPQWAKGMATAPNQADFSDLVINETGQLYTAGYLTGTLEYNFGGSYALIGNYSKKNVLLLTCDGTGFTLLGRTLTTAYDNSEYHAVEVDSSGNMYTAGYVMAYQTYDLGNDITVTGNCGIPGDKNYVLSKADPDGTRLYAETPASGPSENFLYDLAFGPEDKLYAVGAIYARDTYKLRIIDVIGDLAVEVDGGCPSCSNVVLIRFNTEGEALWGRSIMNETLASHFHKVVVASDGSIYTIGSITGTNPYHFDVGVSHTGVYNGPQGNAVLLKYEDQDTTGQALWVRGAYSGSGQTQFTDVDVAPDGSIYVVGSFYTADEFDFGNEVSIKGYTNDYQAMLIKYDSDGNALWVKRALTNPENVGYNAVTVGSDGSVYVGGYIEGTGTVEFDTEHAITGMAEMDTMLTGEEGRMLLLMKWNSDGMVQWAKGYKEGTASSEITELDINSSNQLGVAARVYQAGVIGLENDVILTGTYSNGYTPYLILYQD